MENNHREKKLEVHKISQKFQWQRFYSVNLLWIQLTIIIIALAKLLPSVYVFCYISILLSTCFWCV